MASKANIVVDQGATFTTTLNLTDDNGQPIDLTGYSVVGQFKRWYTSTNSFSFVASIPTPSTGQIDLMLDANATSNLYPGRYVYDVITIDGSGNVIRIVEGILSITPGVSDQVLLP